MQSLNFFLENTVASCFPQVLSDISPGKEEWKQQNISPYYDFMLIEGQLATLKNLSVTDNVFGLIPRAESW